MNEPLYTPEDPCRCGYDGEGVHQCHAGRDPRYPHGRCTNPAESKFVARLAPLSGMQMKAVGDWFHYCTSCWEELND